MQDTIKITLDVEPAPIVTDVRIVHVDSEMDIERIARLVVPIEELLPQPKDET